MLFYSFTIKTKSRNMRLFMLLVAVTLFTSVSYAESNSPPVDESITIEKAVIKFDETCGATITLQMIAPKSKSNLTPAVENSTAYVAEQPAKTFDGHKVVSYALLRYRTSDILSTYKNYIAGQHDYSLTGYNKRS
jgi:hypothetical protein